MGVTASTLTLGSFYINSSQAAAFAGGLGAKNSAISDTNGEQQAIVSYLNSHGGAGGRHINLVNYQVDLTASNATSNAAECADFTQDHHVYAALASMFEDETEVGCLAAHHVISVDYSDESSGQAAFQQYGPYYYAPGAFETVAAGRALVDGLQAQGYLSSAARVGVLYGDFSYLRASLTEGVVPELARYGIKPTDSIPISFGGQASDVGNTAAQVQNAELHFRAEGIDHVILLDFQGSIGLFFMEDAQSQQYTPRYGLGSWSWPSYILPDVGAGQMHGAVGIGWSPTVDVDPSQYPTSPARHLCQQILDAAGYPAQSPADAAQQFAYCDYYFLIKAVFDRTRNVTPTEFQATVGSLRATTQLGAHGLSEFLAPGKQWGVGSYRLLTFSDSCSCFAYKGPAISTH